MLPTIKRHPLRPSEFWQSRLHHLYTLIQVLDDQAEQDLNRRADIERQTGLVQCYLKPADDQHLLVACEYGAALALLRVCQRRSADFSVEIQQPEKTLLIKANQSVSFGWPDWLTTFSLALILDHQDALEIMSTAECVDACSLPARHVDRFWPFLCGAIAALFQRDAMAQQLIEDADSFIQQLTIMEPSYVENCFRPLLPVMRAIVINNQQSFTQSITDAVESFKSYFLNQPDGDAELHGLYDLPLTALIGIGKKYGLNGGIDSEYLLQAFPGTHRFNTICANYPPLSIYDALEADWFIKSEGFSEHSKSTLVQRESKLFASYQARHAAGIPRAKLNFELLEANENPYTSEHFQPALDCGQLLQQAEILARQPQLTQSGKEYYQLESAITAIDLALKYLQAMGGKIEPSSLHSSTGQTLFAAEPGRFNPQRLLVYRNALASQAGLAQKEEGIALNHPERTAKQQVYALIEELKPYLLPVLQGLATDNNHEIFNSLKPKPEDYRKVFSAELAKVAQQHYKNWDEQERQPIHYDENTRIDAYMAPAGMLREDNELSRHFPGGYQSIANQLNPQRIWASWKYYQQGDSSGYSMNGLVWVDDHWAWFPKPYRLG